MTKKDLKLIMDEVDKKHFTVAWKKKVVIELNPIDFQELFPNLTKSIPKDMLIFFSEPSESVVLNDRGYHICANENVERGKYQTTTNRYF